MDTNFNYKIKDISITSFSIKRIEDYPQINTEEISVSFELDIAESEDRLIKIGWRIKYLSQDIEFLDIKTETIFEYFNYDNFDSKNKEFLAILVGISYSTTRGIIYSQTMHQLLNRYFLPIIAPMDFLNKKD